MSLFGEIVFNLFLLIAGILMVQTVLKEQRRRKIKEQPVEVKRYFYLKETVLCVQCDCVFSNKDYNQCPACGNTSTYYHINFALLSEESKSNSLKLKGVTIQ
jgi:RNA polymerase subunit RPABC4/transcription elongation factor Spt4